MANISRHAQNIIATAQSWIGTPYHHRASKKGVGCDCFGLVRGIWRECIGTEPFHVPHYAADWRDEASSEELMQIAHSHFIAQNPQSRSPGQILLFRWKPAHPVKHAAILSYHNKIIHAYSRVCVVETPLSSWWQRRIVAVYDFPPSFNL